MVLPKVECETSSRGYARFVIGPMERGHGITIGNALRRVLLSSTAGAAITSIRVSDIYHEFSTIPDVKEDMTQLILNVKQVRLKIHSDGSEPSRLHLEVGGEGVVTAGDLECPSDVEIINPDLYLFTVDSDEAEVEIELTVQRGKGYSPAEERDKLPIGEIPVDAIFSPIRKVGYEVQQARVGQMTNFDRLIMEIWTDGTIQPQEALSEAAEVLVKHLLLVAGVEEEIPEEEAEEEGIPAHVYEILIEDLGLNVRVYNCLKRTGITNVGEVLEKLEKGEEEMMAIRNFGPKSLFELKEKLQDRGLLWTEEEEEEESEE
ncbi:MAG: DNA-directed RNA polymerase subunit alpha [Anaerolineales bacterium]|nr:MAG: DNA-directed RNA polymerase subunit alpha [Anaerolineales bacterium]